MSAVTRIVAGVARGRRLRVPAHGTRPTTDRVREAVFSALVARMDLDGARVLDLYAGSGALGLEALSRGAAHALLVESDARAADVATANVATVGLPGATVRRMSVAAALSQPCPQPYDVVFADPPYSLTNTAVVAALTTLLDQHWVHPGSVVVLERASRAAETSWPPGLSATWNKRYGETRVEIATCYRPPL